MPCRRLKKAHDDVGLFLFQDIYHLFNIHHYHIGNLLFGLALHIDDKVVVAGVVAGSTRKLLDVVLARGINLLDSLPRLILGKTTFSQTHDSDSAMPLSISTSDLKISAT